MLFHNKGMDSMRGLIYGIKKFKTDLESQQANDYGIIYLLTEEGELSLSRRSHAFQSLSPFKLLR